MNLGTSGPLVPRGGGHSHGQGAEGGLSGHSPFSDGQVPGEAIMLGIRGRREGEMGERILGAGVRSQGSRPENSQPALANDFVI